VGRVQSRDNSSPYYNPGDYSQPDFWDDYLPAYYQTLTVEDMLR